MPLWNTSKWNGATWNASGTTTIPAQPATRTIHQTDRFILELRNSSGEMIGEIMGWWGGSWEQTASEAPVCEFNVPLTNVEFQAGNLARPNQIWLYDGAYGIKEKFAIASVRKESAHRGAHVAVTAEGFLSQLSREWVTEHTVATGSIQGIVNALLNLQVNGSPILKGALDPAIANQTIGFTAAKKSILAALRQLSNDSGIGGHFYVDLTKRLRWKKFTTTGATHIVDTGYNQIQFEEEVDWSSLANRIYAEGGIVDGEPVTLASPGYVQDSSSVSTYGVQPFRLQARGVRDSTQLLKAANAELARRKLAITRRKVGAIDVAYLQGTPENPDPPTEDVFIIGHPIMVIPPENFGGSAFTTNVLRFKRSLDTPANAEIETGDNVELLPPDLSDFLSDNVIDDSEHTFQADWDIDNIYTDLSGKLDFKTAATKAELPTTELVTPTFGFTTSDNNFWGWNGTDWTTLGGGLVTVADEAARDALDTSTKVCYQLDDGRIYSRKTDNSWKDAVRFVEYSGP